MNINLESLFYNTLNNFDYVATSRLACLKCKAENKIPKNGLLRVDYHPELVRPLRDADRAWMEIRNYCEILDINESNLYSLVRSIRKWHDKTKWQYCFDFAAHQAKINKFLSRP